NHRCPTTETSALALPSGRFVLVRRGRHGQAPRTRRSGDRLWVAPSPAARDRACSSVPGSGGNVCRCDAWPDIVPRSVVSDGRHGRSSRRKDRHGATKFTGTHGGNKLACWIRGGGDAGGPGRAA